MVETDATIGLTSRRRPLHNRTNITAAL